MTPWLWAAIVVVGVALALWFLLAASQGPPDEVDELARRDRRRG